MWLFEWNPRGCGHSISDHSSRMTKPRPLVRVSSFGEVISNQFARESEDCWSTLTFLLPLCTNPDPSWVYVSSFWSWNGEGLRPWQGITGFQTERGFAYRDSSLEFVSIPRTLLVIQNPNSSRGSPGMVQAPYFSQSTMVEIYLLPPTFKKRTSNHFNTQVSLALR